MGNLCQKNKNKSKNILDVNSMTDHSSLNIYEANIPGKKKKTEYADQDSMDIIATELGEHIKFFGVYDGHGSKGREASQVLRLEINKKLLKDKNKIKNFNRKEQVDKYFKDLFKAIQNKFDYNSSEYELSGSCAICVLIIETRLYSINLGDSRAVLGCKKNDKKVAIEMSLDHKPIRDDERKRICESGGEVSDKLSGVHRVFRKNDEAPGLAVSRSIGDIVAHECGVSFEPEIIEREIEVESDMFVVIASDGVWDAMTSPEVVGLIFEFVEEKKDKACKFLVDEARKRWEILNLYKQKYVQDMMKEKKGDNKMSKENSQLVMDIDDISAIILFFNYENM